mmetsp:Transcript_67094/g.169398  ORF Transcript_67094/g.169398 Transcript_67094/m.169398 type:complete len:395 (-) Transcript_67094:99-1283(-)
MFDEPQQILHAAPAQCMQPFLGIGNGLGQLASAAPMQIASSTTGVNLPGATTQPDVSIAASFGLPSVGLLHSSTGEGATPLSSLEQRATLMGIAPERLKLAQQVGSLRLRMIQEAAQQHYLAAYAQQVAEVQQLHEKQQEAAQLALIMEAAEAQAEMAKQSLEEDKEDDLWRRRSNRNVAICGNWQRGYCKHGEGCQFSHPEKEFGASSTKRGPADLMRHNFKTAVCRLFSSGNCAHGSRCMFAHGPAELRSPGMPLSKDEEEMVQRVAAGGKRNKEAAAAAAATGSQPGGGMHVAASAQAAPSVAQQVATAQMIALAGHAAASMPPLPGMSPMKPLPLPSDLQLDSSQKRALDGLSKLGLDASTLDMMGQLASGAGCGGPPGGEPRMKRHKNA